jgi:cytochrome P450
VTYGPRLSPFSRQVRSLLPLPDNLGRLSKYKCAGSISTAGTLSALLFYLSRNPDCYQRLANEIRSTFGNSTDIRNGIKLSSSQYLRAWIEETLRIGPPIPGTLWRVWSPSPEEREEPMVVDGVSIPPVTEVGVNMFAIHHNEKYFPEAFVFKPERWLPSTTSEDQLKALHEAFCPFSVGDRGCPKKSMAYLEPSLVISKILWHFDFEVAPGKLGEVRGGTPGVKDGRDLPGEYQLYDAFSGLHDGPYLMFHPRGGYFKELKIDGLSLK